MRLLATNLRLLGWLALAVFLPCCASAIPTIRLTASRTTVLADGRDSTQIIAEVRDSSGRLVSDGTTVTFQTSLGAFQRSGPTATAPTEAGSARVLLTSSVAGTAVVTAASTGGGFDQIQAVFTNDPSETFQGNAYAVVSGDSSLIYAPGDKTIEAVGKVRKDPSKQLAGARLTFRNIELWADDLLVDCSATSVRAQGNVLLQRGKAKLRCLRLYYPLMTGIGYAIAEVDGHWRPVSIKGPDLKVTIRKDALPDKMLAMTSEADAPQLISASQILLFPGDKLQFKRPRFYQYQQAILSFPFYSLSLSAKQLFADQVVTLGSQGLGVNFPLYYDMSPSTTGLLRIRNGERYGTSISATRPGLAVDLTQSYSSLGGAKRYTGNYGFTDINRSDWGFHFTHNQEFSPASTGSITLELPQHQSLFGSANLQQQFSGFHANLNLYGNRTLRGINTDTSEADIYLETNSRRLGTTGYQYAVGATASSSHTSLADAGSSMTSEGLRVRMFSRPMHLDSATTVTHSWSVGQAWATGGQSGATVLSTLSLTRLIGNAGNMQLTYDFIREPVSLLVGGGENRLSSALYLSSGTKVSFYVYGSAMLDGPDRSLMGDARYNFARRWYVGASANVQAISAVSYHDFEFSLSRSIGLRELTITYATLSHRFYFDMQAARF